MRDVKPLLVLIQRSTSKGRALHCVAVAYDLDATARYGPQATFCLMGQRSHPPQLPAHLSLADVALSESFPRRKGVGPARVSGRRPAEKRRRAGASPHGAGGPSRAVPGRSAAALAGAPGARLSGCGRRGEGNESGGAYPPRKSEVKKPARILRLPFPAPNLWRLPPRPTPARPAGATAPPGLPPAGQNVEGSGASLPRGIGTPALPVGAGVWESVPEAPRPAEPPV